MRTFHGHYHYDSANLRYHAVLYDSVTKISSRLVCVNNVDMFQKGLREDRVHWRVFITPNMTNQWTRHLRRCCWRGDREPGIGFVTAWGSGDLDKDGLDKISTNLESIRAGRVVSSNCKEGFSERTL